MAQHRFLVISDEPRCSSYNVKLQNKKRRILPNHDSHSPISSSIDTALICRLMNRCGETRQGAYRHRWPSTSSIWKATANPGRFSWSYALSAASHQPQYPFQHSGNTGSISQYPHMSMVDPGRIFFMLAVAVCITRFTAAAVRSCAWERSSPSTRSRNSLWSLRLPISLPIIEGAPLTRGALTIPINPRAARAWKRRSGRNQLQCFRGCRSPASRSNTVRACDRTQLLAPP